MKAGRPPKLKDELVRWLRTEWRRMKRGHRPTQAELGVANGVHANTIQKAVSGETYWWVR